MNDVKMTGSASLTSSRGYLARVEESGAREVWEINAEVMIRQVGCHAPAGSAIKETNLNQVRFDDFFDRVFFFMNGG
jgi:hypothetical protein